MNIEGYKEVSCEIWRKEEAYPSLYVIEHWLDQYGGLRKQVRYFIQKSLEEDGE